MFCPRCGTQCSDTDKFCIGCGNILEVSQPQINNQVFIAPTGKCTLQIKRDTMMGFLVDLTVTINDDKQYSIDTGEGVTLDLFPGTYVIKYKVWNRREQSVTLNAKNGGNYKLLFGYDALWGGFKVSKKSVLE